jgi:hypothetical protein
LITPTSRTVPFYLTLFVFSPYLEEHEQVQKIYPSELDEIKAIESYTEIPSKMSGYEIKAQFPTMDIGTNQVNRYQQRFHISHLQDHCHQYLKPEQCFRLIKKMLCIDANTRTPSSCKFLDSIQRLHSFRWLLHLETLHREVN